MGKALKDSHAFGFHGITYMNNMICVDASYSDEFRKMATTEQGEWRRIKRGKGFWFFPIENEKEVRQLLLEAYGDDGQKHDRCVVDIDLEKYMAKDSAYLMLDKLTIAMRTAKNAKVRLHKDARCVSGDFGETGGTSHGAIITYKGGTVVRYERCPMEVYKKVAGMPGITMYKDHIFD